MTLDSEMTALEAAGKTSIPAGNDYAIFRFDGVNFGAYTKKLDAPEDAQFVKDMDHAAKTLVEYFHAVGAFVVSDEISLILKADALGQFPYAGGIQKIATTGASVLTADMTVRRPKQRPALFDGRGRGAADADAVRGYLFWRQASGMKNAVSMVVSSLVQGGHKLVMNMPTSERVELLKERGIILEDVTTPGFRQGRIILRTTEPHEVSWVNKRTGESHSDVVTRRKLIIRDAPTVPPASAEVGFDVASFFWEEPDAQ